MANQILTLRGIEGVTYTGGEPMLQAHALVLLSQRLRQMGLTVVCYTGYTLEALRHHTDSWVSRLLNQVDILIDGPFVQAEAASLLWRGSRNQQVYFLTETYRDWKPKVNQASAQVELTLATHDFTTTGIWPLGFVERLEDALRRQVCFVPSV